MGDMAEDFREMREARRKVRAELGEDCIGCITIEPKRNPTVLLPGQKCRYCGHQDTRERHRKCPVCGSLAEKGRNTCGRMSCEATYSDAEL